MRAFPFLLIILFSVSTLSCQTPNQTIEESEFIKGVYGNPATLLKAGYRFDSLGMNAVFVRSISLNQEFYKTAKEQGIKVFVEFPTLNGKEYLQDHPNAWPINEKGEQSPPADWFMGICPTHEGFKDYRKKQLLDILGNYAVDGVFLDYVHWHAQFETTEPILPETCFCNRCTSIFSEEIQQEIPGENISQKASWILTNRDPEWRKWRVGILNGWIEDMGSILKEKQPEAKLGVFYCSWYPTDYDSALYRNLGIDPVAIAERADVLSPMLFHHMKGRPTAWVGEYVDWLGKTIQTEKIENILIWPIVQAHNNPGIISPEEFRQVMIEGSRSPSTGIMMFSDQSLVENPEKIKVMKELYKEEIK
ncbi:glycoside hydrolase family 10 protein [Aquiflexum lacus]|uniref:hypothetical protein n=1 Tax=Aquiflexum lacus TaxID=2483805 RepID=UPI00189358C0|nr:hypothetical protein [Aquiflexum lacus]